MAGRGWEPCGQCGGTGECSNPSRYQETDPCGPRTCNNVCSTCGGVGETPDAARRRIVIETPCIHGETTRHRAADPDSYLSTYLCDGAQRRTLTEGEYIWWCQNHDASGDEYACYRWRFVTGTVNSGDCQMVRRGLLPPEMEG